MKPSPVVPVVHSQMYPPAVFMQVASALQVAPPPGAHSSTSMQPSGTGSSVHVPSPAAFAGSLLQSGVPV